MASMKELNDHLFAALDRLDAENLSPEKMELEVKRATAICDIADQINMSARLSIEAAKLFAVHGNKVLDRLPKIGEDKPTPRAETQAEK